MPATFTYRSVSFMAQAKNNSDTRRHILRAALRHFANAGYAATSVQQIVGEAKVSKPALYYHFQDKAGLFQALVHEAHDERYRLLCEAAEKSRGIRAQLENILGALFDYFRRNRELMRISFATMFAAPGEVPEDLSCAEKCERNFEFVHSLIKRAQKNGELERRFDSRELAFGFYGLTHFYLVAHLVARDCEPDKKTAKRVVELFLAGARAKRRSRVRK
ncbi:MAG TPA: TetR/AcrR family transcriptional regulator [Candidatus Baltobacteraceae bacterium]|nr:TetR/AcrR family transcriptional regulator [Candidatus Baltobacteraceae bacterium]